MSIFRNPISYSIYFFVVLLVIAGIGASPLTVLQHLFLPYTVDISRGVGDVGASIFRAVTLFLQFLIGLFAVLLTNAEKTGQRIVISIVGILLVAIYFLIVVFGYIMPRFH